MELLRYVQGLLYRWHYVNDVLLEHGFWFLEAPRVLLDCQLRFIRTRSSGYDPADVALLLVVDIVLADPLLPEDIKIARLVPWSIFQEFRVGNLRLPLGFEERDRFCAEPAQGCHHNREPHVVCCGVGEVL